uniref:Uncharacterized protein n=1 Tax=Helianthus annuus TaxID=4232 RepID=A0A251TIS2_HELAN
MKNSMIYGSLVSSSSLRSSTVQRITSGLFTFPLVKYMGKPSDPAYYILKEDTSPCIFGSIEKQRWSYACAKQLIERFIYAEGAENGFENAFIGNFNIMQYLYICIYKM